MPSPQVIPHVADLANPTRSGAPEMPTSPPKSPQVLKYPQSPQPGRRIPRCGRAVARPAWRALLLAGAVAAMLGMPCFAAAHDDVVRLQTLIESSLDTTVAADVASGAITAGHVTFAATLPAALRDAFVSGQWNPTAMLLENFDEVRAVAARLPFIRGF